MKNLNPRLILSIAVLFMFSIISTSCVVRHDTIVVKEKRIPPGQAKKIYGGKSAKNYAPGQRKKTKKVIIVR